MGFAAAWLTYGERWTQNIAHAHIESRSFCQQREIAPSMATSTKTPSAKPSAKPAGSGLFLNRYTSLPIALDVLAKKHITLLSPETWEDRNDAYYLERYRDERKLRSLLAICFSLHRETFHHWRVFSSGSSGVCIEFDKEKL